MKTKENWDWSTESKEVPVGEWKEEFNWVEDFKVSPDGEKIASIVNVDEMEFGVCENGTCGDEVFEKAWSLNYTPEGKYACFVSSDEEWTVCVDGKLWEERFDYIWDMKITSTGKIGASIQSDGEYAMAVDDKTWDDRYDNLTGGIISDNGKSAAVVQIDSMSQGDIEKFKSGLFAVAVDGEIRTDNHLNIWDVSFSRNGEEIGYSIRKTRTEYSVGRNRDQWETFQCSWGPEFTSDNSLIAPVKKGKWFLYKDNLKFWEEGFLQILKITSANGNTACAVSDRYGYWTVAENGKPWNFRCDMMISDLYYTDDGKNLVGVYKNSGFWDVSVNNSTWNLKADKLWNPVASDDGSVLAARMEKDGRYFLVVNGKTFKDGFDLMFDPVISPDNGKVLLKAVDNGVYKRKVLSLDQIL